MRRPPILEEIRRDRLLAALTIAGVAVTAGWAALIGSVFLGIRI